MPEVCPRSPFRTSAHSCIPLCSVPTRMLDLRRLRLLRELDARGTVHAAARALDYTPSAISQQLAVLEREAGATLLERTGRTLRLTDAGRLLVDHAAALLDRMEAAEADLAALVAGRPAGTVQIAAFQTAFLQLVAPGRRRGSPPITPTSASRRRRSRSRRPWRLLRLGHLDVVVGDEYEGVPRPSLARPRTRHAAHGAGTGDAPCRPRARRSQPGGARPARGRRVGRLPRSSTGHRAMQLRVCRERGGFEPNIRFPLRRPRRSSSRWCARTARPRAPARPRAESAAIERRRRHRSSPAAASAARSSRSHGGRGRPPWDVVLAALSASRTARPDRPRGRRAERRSSRMIPTETSSAATKLQPAASSPPMA